MDTTSIRPLDTGDELDDILDQATAELGEVVATGWNLHLYRETARSALQQHAIVDRRNVLARRALVRSSFRIGDLLRIGERATRGPVYSIWLDLLEEEGDDVNQDYALKTLYKFRRLADLYPPEDRIYDISQSVYLELAGIEPPDFRRRHLLAAQNENWSKAQARAVANETKGNLSDQDARDIGLASGGQRTVPAGEKSDQRQGIEVNTDDLWEWAVSSIGDLCSELRKYSPELANAKYLQHISAGQRLLGIVRPSPVRDDPTVEEGDIQF